MGLVLAMAVLEAVYLGGYFALENSEQLSQYVKGMVKFALHFGFLVCGTQYVIDRGERMLRRTIGAFVLGLALNCAYGVAQLAAQVGAGVNLDKRLIGPLTFGQGSLGGINVYGQTTAVESGSYVSLGVYRVNALALDPNHLGIMLCVPILLLLPFALRAGVRSRSGLMLAALLAFFACVEVLDALALRPARPRLRPPRAGVAVAPATAAAALRRAASRARSACSPSRWPPSSYVRQVFRSRVTLSDNSAKVHFQFFDLVQPVLDAHPVFGLGLNTFSVYYQFLTGKTNWGPHSFYIALLDETGLVGACVFAAFLAWVGIRLAVILRASRALERRGDPEAGEWRALAIGLTAGLAATLIANVFYLTMQFYYFYGLVLIIAAASALAVARVRARRVMTDVSVVIVSYESRPLLARCLAALAADTGRVATREIIVVDQASPDGTADWLAAEHPDVRVVALPQNVGFGAGNNRGAEVASGRLLLLLNSDAYVRPGAIDELVRFADARPAAGIVGPRLLWPDGRLQRSCRRFPTVFRLATEYLYLRKIAPRSPHPQRLLLRRVRPRRGLARRLGDGRLRARAPRAVRAAGRLRRGVLPLLRGGRPALPRRGSSARRPGTTRPRRSSTSGAAPPAAAPR